LVHVLFVLKIKGIFEKKNLNESISKRKLRSNFLINLYIIYKSLNENISCVQLRWSGIAPPKGLEGHVFNTSLMQLFANNITKHTKKENEKKN